MLNGHGRAKDPVETARAYVQGAATVKADLLQERQNVSAMRDDCDLRLSEIDALLAQLPASEPLENVPLGVHQRRLFEVETAAAPEVVLAALPPHGEKIDAAEIIRRVQAERPDIEIRLIHSAIYRLKKAKRIAVDGPRGSRVYGRKIERMETAAMSA